MPKFRKKPVVVEAIQWDGKDMNILKEIKLLGSHRQARLKPNTTNQLLIKTLEGDMTAMPMDWIIQGVSGEIYPCKPDIFELTYEEINPWNEYPKKKPDVDVLGNGNVCNVIVRNKEGKQELALFGTSGFANEPLSFFKTKSFNSEEITHWKEHEKT